VSTLNLPLGGSTAPNQIDIVLKVAPCRSCVSWGGMKGEGEGGGGHLPQAENVCHIIKYIDHAARDVINNYHKL